MVCLNFVTPRFSVKISLCPTALLSPASDAFVAATTDYDFRLALVASSVLRRNPIVTADRERIFFSYYNVRVAR